MNAFDRFDREFAQAVEDLADARTPDYFDDVLERAVSGRQRPAWTFPERWIPMGVLARRPALVPTLPWRTVGLFLLLAVLLAAIVAIGVGRARLERPALPYGIAANGLLAYSVEGDIYGRDPQTGELRLLVGGPAVDVGPSFSRDGTQFSFVRLIDEGTHTIAVMVANADGSNVRTAVEPEVADGLHWIEWSPNGEMLLIVNSAAGVPWLSVVNVSGEPQRRAISVDLEVHTADWRAGTDELILYGRDRATRGLGFYAVPIDGGSLRPIVSPGDDGQVHHGRFSISHDGRFLAYTSEDRGGNVSSHIVDLDSGETRTLDGWFNQGWPTFSPDGERLALVRYPASGAAAQAYIGSSTGDGTDAVAIGPEVQNQPGSAGLQIQFSPDGTSLLIVHAAAKQAWAADVETGAYEAFSIADDEWVTWQRLHPSTTSAPDR